MFIYYFHSFEWLKCVIIYEQGPNRRKNSHNKQNISAHKHISKNIIKYEAYYTYTRLLWLVAVAHIWMMFNSHSKWTKKYMKRVNMRCWCKKKKPEYWICSWRNMLQHNTCNKTEQTVPKSRVSMNPQWRKWNDRDERKKQKLWKSFGK